MPSEAKRIDLGICSCCGGTYGIIAQYGHVEMACDKKEKVGKPCTHYGRCQAQDCLLATRDVVAKQVKDAEMLLATIKATWAEYGKVLLSVPDTKTRAVRLAFIMLQKEGWLMGHVHDEHGGYYRLFPDEFAYAKGFVDALLLGAQSLDDEGEAELARLGFDVPVVKQIISSVIAGGKHEGQHDRVLIRCVGERDILACKACGDSIEQACTFDDEYS